MFKVKENNKKRTNFLKEDPLDGRCVAKFHAGRPCSLFSVVYSPSSFNEDEDPFWALDNKVEDFGILPALLNPVSWDEGALKNHDLFFDEVGDQH